MKEHPLDIAVRLQALGVHVQSETLQMEAERLRTFSERGGNRAMRRARAKRAKAKR